MEAWLSSDNPDLSVPLGRQVRKSLAHAEPGRCALPGHSSVREAGSAASVKGLLSKGQASWEGSLLMTGSSSPELRTQGSKVGRGAP
jgi:hypothetical protein